MPTQATLQATPDPVIIDLEAGQKTGTTSVEYSKEKDYVLWHRWKPGAWLRVKLQASTPDDPALFHGYVTSPTLEPGQVYQVAIWERDIDPNELPPSLIPIRAVAWIAVFALRKRPEPRDFMSDENEQTGGTWREHQIVTKAPVHAWMTVSTAAPQIDSNGFLSFAGVQGSAWGPTDQSFLLRITDLFAGTFYHELVRLTDEFGNWQFIRREFTTLRRRIRLEPTDLFIGDDSDDLSNGEASFTFTLETGDSADPSSWVERGKLTYANSNLETGKSATPVPSGQIVVGPETVKPNSRHIRIRVEGVEDDTGSFFPDLDDEVTGRKDLFLPAGTTDELVSQRPDVVSADASWNEFRFSLSFKYWIEYL